MKKVTFVQDGALVVAPANYGLVDFSVGGQLARKELPEADGRTSRGLEAINDLRDRIGEYIKDYAKESLSQYWGRIVIGY